MASLLLFTAYLLSLLIGSLIMLVGILVLLLAILLPELNRKSAQVPYFQNHLVDSTKANYLQTDWLELENISCQPNCAHGWWTKHIMEPCFEKLIGKPSQSYSLQVLANLLNIRSGLILFVPYDKLDCCREIKVLTIPPPDNYNGEHNSCCIYVIGKYAPALTGISLEQRMGYLDLTLSRYKDTSDQLYKTKRPLQFKFFGGN